MFTGIIQQQGVIKKKTAAYLQIEAAARLVEQLSLGESIAVDGVCLTVSKIPTPTTFTADVMSETARRTTLGNLRVGGCVNLELPMKADGRFGGHMVQGHIDGTATLRSIRHSGNSHIFSFDTDESLLAYMVEKGSVAINGISLTVISVSGGGFSVGIIPHTKKRTTLARAEVGGVVNVEVDMVAKYIYKFSRASIKNRYEK